LLGESVWRLQVEKRGAAAYARLAFARAVQRLQRTLFLDNILTPNDYQAPILHLLGLDHTKLLYNSNGREQRPIDGRAARVVKESLAYNPSEPRPLGSAAKTLPDGRGANFYGVSP
jgi:hypothetical protein